ncbi:MAG: dienelactone hydrolase family protein [Candidatus Hydrogenedentes bacterium]|nr:dienelactone hydrolase family protein [Candidatus Hydrogenedentota bacterium]
MRFHFRFISAIICLSTGIIHADEPYAQRYTEPVEKSHANRQTGFTQIHGYIQELHDLSPAVRDESFKPDYSSLHAYAISTIALRDRVRKSIGFPPPLIRRAAPARWEHVADDPSAQIYRLWIEVLEGVDAYAIVSFPRGIEKPAPLMICQHGGGGNPELVHGMLEGAGTGNYGWMTQRALAEGYVTLEPALIFPFGGKEAIEGPDRRTMDEQLQNLGTSILAVELWKIFRLTDAVLQRPEVDRDKIGMMGLSYGGLYTLYAAALDPRIDAAVSSCFFNERRRYSWQDWSFFNYMNTFNDAEICALISPRPLLIEVGDADTLFAIEGARAEAGRARRHWDGLGKPENFVLDVFPGGHEFKGNMAYAFMQTHLKKGTE